MPHIVVLGSSYAGMAFLNNFLKSLGSTIPADLSITVVNPKDYHYSNMASFRLLAEFDQWKDRLFVPLDKIFGKHGEKEEQRKRLNFIKAYATEVDSASVKLSNGESLGFDYLIVATGSSYRHPFKLDKTEKQSGIDSISPIAQRIKESNSILIIGGGAVGVETAGDLATSYPDKKITLVHSGSAILGNYDGVSPKFQAKVASILEKKGVKIVLDESISDDITSESFNPLTSKTLTSKKGTTFESDVQIVSFGQSPNSGFMESLNVLNESRLIKVNEYLQVKGFQNIFALGDVCDAPFTKQAYQAGIQGEYLGKGLAKTLKEKKGRKAFSELNKPIPPQKNLALFVSLGKDSGLGQMGSMIMGSFMVKSMKSKDLFYQKGWTDFHLKAPK